MMDRQDKGSDDMSVIAVRNGVMACDSMISSPGGTIVFYMPKIRLHVDGSVSGACGTAREIVGFNDAVERNEAEKFEPHSSNFHALIYRPGCLLVEFWGCGKWVEVWQPFYAIGQGRELALGAMEAGADAVKAVEVACLRSVWCGGAVYSEELGDG